MKLIGKEETGKRNMLGFKNKGKNIGIPSNTYYRSLMKSMLLIGVVVPFMPMLLVSGVIFYQFQASYKEKIHAHLEELINGKKGIIEYFLDERLDDISYIANSFSFEELSMNSFLDESLGRLRKRYGTVFDSLQFIDDKGVRISYAGESDPRAERFQGKLVYLGSKNPGPFITDIPVGSEGQQSALVVVKKTWMDKEWFLTAAISSDALSTITADKTAAKDGYLFILNREGKYLTEPPLSNKAMDAFLTDPLNIKRMRSKAVFLVSLGDDTGVKNLYVSTYVNGGNWFLVYRQNFSDAFKGLTRAKVVAIAVFLIVSVLIFANAYSLSRKMVRRIALADKEKEKMNEKMYQTGKLAAIGELAAGIAHEINNPVAIMVEEAGWIDDLLEEEEFGESKNLAEFKRALKQIRVQGKRCKEITHKLLSFARKSDSRIEEVRLNEFIEDIISISAKRAKLEGVVLSKEIEKDLPHVAVSPTELQQVILNLINNAIDAMEEKGGKINISARSEKEKLIIDVSDNGPGIPKDDLTRIFDPFFTTKPVGKGTGLGLSICYGIIKKLGGDISVSRTGDSGTTFRIKIPIKDDKGFDTAASPEIMPPYQEE